MSATIVVTLGRNIGRDPMPIGAWNCFKRDVRDTLDVMGFTIIQRPAFTLDNDVHVDQLGVWDTTTEPACTFVALADRNRISTHSVEYIRQCLDSALKPLLSDYRQDAIGCIVVEGTNHLVVVP